MKNLLITFIFLSISFLIYGHRDSTSIYLKANWNTGDEYNFGVTKIRKQWQKGELSSNDSVYYKAKLKVLDKTDSTYKLSWSFDSKVFNDFSINPEQFDKGKVYVPLEVIYYTESDGAFLAVDNWAEVGQRMTKGAYELLDKIAGKDDESADLMKNKLKNIRVLC